MKPATDMRQYSQRWLSLLKCTKRCVGCNALTVDIRCLYCRHNISRVPATRPLPGDPGVHL